MKRSVLYCFFYLLLLGVTACVNDEIRSFDDLPEGETTVSATVEFNPLTPALATRAVEGDAIKSIGSLCVLVYGMDGKLVNKHLIKKNDTEQVPDYTEGEMERKDEEGKDRIAESKTPYARFHLKIPYGRYRIYAVANMGDLADYADEIETMTGLKSILLTWQSDVRKNNQMLGHFTEKGVYCNDDEDYILTINRKGMELRAGIRRVASKVTLAYDGSQLKEGVFVYIKSARIKDIPRYCRLGNKNAVRQSRDSLIEFGDTIRYDLQYDADTKKTVSAPFDEYYVARVTKGRPYFPHNDKYEKAFHTETERALFFYENMQGTGKDKRQMFKDGNSGSLLYADKDDMPYGTYIEVEAYYRSIHEGRVSNGNIKYRFMLGKNVTTDYNAERNHHYKLTLRFKNFANDVDWHIDYEEEDPSIQVPEPYYISYLYNHKMMLPVKINAGGSVLESLTAEIDTNSWAPFEAFYLDYARNLDPNVTKSVNLNPWNGFLSLRRTQTTVVTMPGDNQITSLNRLNMEYWNNTKRGKREYEVNTDPGEYDSDEGDGKYYVSKDEDGKLFFSIPMYTRAKQLLVKSAYTGNNPYVAYQRKAVVRFTGKLANGKTIIKFAKIMQVRRVVNPKGIWRKHDNDAAFHVTLKRLPREASESFEEFTSEGKWRAYPIVDQTNLIGLGGQNDTVMGSTGTPIDFTIHFNGTCGEKENRCAIIRVEYHDYSCFHLIFVRQGGAPLDLVGKGTLWHSYNMCTRNTEAGCPLEEGSLFRFCNWDQPIDAINNENDKIPWINVSAESFKDHANTPFLIAGSSERKLWSQITSNARSDVFTAPDINPVIPGKTVSVASFEDYNELWESDAIENGYGVMYGNDATGTLSSLEEVYGHRYDKHQENGGGYGMRGIFVYNKNSGDNLFFPIGASGYGRRKHYDGAGGKGTAVLRYAGRNRALDKSAPFQDPWLGYRPLFYDLYMRPGAIYWLQRRVSNVRNGDEDAIAWDINYFTFDFNYIATSNVFSDNNSDACFVRCVEK